MKEVLKENLGIEWHRHQLESEDKEKIMYVIEGQRELQRIDMLNLIGEMAVSIGHHLRNPLTTVRSYLQMFSRKQSLAEHREQFITMIEEIDQANIIITEFLSLAKNKRTQFKAR